MDQPLLSEHKKIFQLERMILFSDAVFAIAITLLAIEIKIPEIPKTLVTEHGLAEGLAELIPKFIGFLISFLIIGLYWTIHHRMFGFVINYNQRLLWLNLFFLLAVALMPFSTGFYSVYILRFLNAPIIVYVANICFLGIMNFFLWKYISNPRRGLTEGLSRTAANYAALRAITIPVIFILMALVYFFVAPQFAIWIPPLIPLLMRIIWKRYERRLKSSEASSQS